MPKTKSKVQQNWFSRYRRLVLSAVVLVALGLAGGWWLTRASADGAKDAPEAEKILALQEDMPFQILIPAYLPDLYDRKNVEVSVDQPGPSGEPMAQLTYHSLSGASLYIREWVPVNPALEILAASHPVETKWGKGWLLKQGDDLIALWVTIGPLRISIYSADQQSLDKEHLMVIGDTMGPASNSQVFSFVVDPPQVKEALPPPPVEIETNAENVQEVTLIVTPGGYSPLRFAVKKGVKVRLIFRQLGEVGCGNELNFPTSSKDRASLALRSPADQKVLEFTPDAVGQFEFYCSHLMYRGVMYVRE